jgi:hypothetical protein
LTDALESGRLRIGSRSSTAIVDRLNVLDERIQHSNAGSKAMQLHLVIEELK